MKVDLAVVSQKLQHEGKRLLGIRRDAERRATRAGLSEETLEKYAALSREHSFSHEKETCGLCGAVKFRKDMFLGIHPKGSSEPVCKHHPWSGEWMSFEDLFVP